MDSPFSPDPPSPPVSLGQVAMEATRAAEPGKLSPFERRLWAAFCDADRDGSGSISKREFYAILAKAPPRTPARAPRPTRPTPHAPRPPSWSLTSQSVLSPSLYFRHPPESFSPIPSPQPGAMLADTR